jgi:hypothetical protein
VALPLLVLLAPPPVPAAEVAAIEELSDEQIVERILDLRRELDALLAALPADLRDEIERRYATSEHGEALVTTKPAPPLTPAPATAVAAPEAVASEAPSREASADTAVAEPAVEGCAELAAFDTNGDGTISGFDRYWRLFRLWRDDGDGEVEPPEVVGLYDAGVREFSSSVRRYETVDGIRGDVRLVGGWVTFELVGKKGGAAALLVDADRLSRGGELTLVNAAGEPLGGLHRLGETSMLSADGVVGPLSCS